MAITDKILNFSYFIEKYLGKKIKEITTALKKKSTIKNIIKLSCRVMAVAAFVLLILLIPFIIFTFQHAISSHNALYTYLHNDSIKKGEPINIIIKNSNISDIITLLEMEDWGQVPTFSTNKSTLVISVGKGTTISPRYFDNKVQDISLEGPDSTLTRRHHARFWIINNSIYCTASHDSGLTIILEGIMPLPTHAIHQNIDLERDYVGKIISNKLNLTISYADNTFPALYKNNNAGSWYYTDGEMLVLSEYKQTTGFKKTMFSLRRIYFRSLGIILDLF